MIFNLNSLKKIIRKNGEISFLLILLFTAVFSTKFYNDNKKIITKNYKNVINNIYFKKSLTHIFNNLSPKYKNINHKISNGETFDRILSSYYISNDEIIKIKKSLNDNYNLNNLRANQIIKFTIDQSKNGKIKSFLFPVSKTEKIILTRNIETDSFEKKNNYYKLK